MECASLNNICEARVPFRQFLLILHSFDRLAKEGDGFKIAMSGLDGGRLLIGACSLGAADACMEILLNWLKVIALLIYLSI